MNDDAPKDENLRIRRLIELDKSSLPPDGGPEFNRLIFATSPYLLQHADNPVDWYPWGDDAFAKAAGEDKPVFLSIGYATCHWCHVMEHEAFEDHDVARVFNRFFVCIKVDREERPDIDEQYMTVSQIMTGSGGWPLNIFMTPDKKPFYAATYLPRTPRMGMPGIIQLLERVAEIWRTDRQKLERDAVVVMEALASHFQPHPGNMPDSEVPEKVFRQLATMYDEKWGGFGSAPKFPMPLNLSFLLRFWKTSGDPAPLAMVEHTLHKLRHGGIFDQIGFGFHRYAVDREWLVPHFEKMLYDQALIATVCLETFQATGDPYYLRVAEEVFSYVLREMTSPEGGFYSGQDADTEGEEGRCYLWTPAEINAALGDDIGPLFCRLFDVSAQGNFEGRTILHLPVPLEECAAREGVSAELLEANLERWRQVLLTVRGERVPPFRDEKVITAWNGLMVAALAKGYAVTGKTRYLDAAERAVAFIETNLTTPGGRLMRSYHRGEGSVPAFLQDYAFLVQGLIELHQATLKPALLDRACSLADDMLRLFDGAVGDGLFETGNDGERLLVRYQNAHDGVLPSGNGMAAFGLFRLGRITGNEGFAKAGEVIARTFMGDVSRQPTAFPTLLAASDYHTGAGVMITLSGREDQVAGFIRTVHRRYIPNLVLRYAGEGGVGEYPAVDGSGTAYVCARNACRPPVTSNGELAALLDAVT